MVSLEFLFKDETLLVPDIYRKIHIKKKKMKSCLNLWMVYINLWDTYIC